MNPIIRLDFKLTYYDVTVQYISHYTTEATLFFFLSSSCLPCILSSRFVCYSPALFLSPFFRFFYSHFYTFLSFFLSVLFIRYFFLLTFIVISFVSSFHFVYQLFLYFSPSSCYNLFFFCIFFSLFFVLLIFLSSLFVCYSPPSFFFTFRPFNWA